MTGRQGFLESALGREMSMGRERMVETRKQGQQDLGFIMHLGAHAPTTCIIVSAFIYPLPTPSLDDIATLGTKTGAKAPSVQSLFMALSGSQTFIVESEALRGVLQVFWRVPDAGSKYSRSGPGVSNRPTERYTGIIVP